MIPRVLQNIVHWVKFLIFLVAFPWTCRGLQHGHVMRILSFLKLSMPKVTSRIPKKGCRCNQVIDGSLFERMIKKKAQRERYSGVLLVVRNWLVSWVTSLFA